MTLKHFTDEKAIQILATKSRRIDITPYELSQTHFEIGKYIGFKILEEFELEVCEINHPQGKREGKRIAFENDIIIISFMRAGVYFGDGIRYIFQNSPYYQMQPIRKIGLTEKELLLLPDIRNKTVILADSVINTGTTMFAVIKQIVEKQPKKLIVTSIVMPDTTAERIQNEFNQVIFYILWIFTD